MDPPRPLWKKPSYNATIKSDAIIGTFVVKVAAYLPSWADPDNKICQYRIEQADVSPFSIDGSGMVYY